MRVLKGWEKYLGLMFRSKHTEPVIFEFDRDVEHSLHMFCVFFPCTIIFKDENDEVIESIIAKPFQFNIKCSKPYRKIIEIPIITINKKYLNKK